MALYKTGMFSKGGISLFLAFAIFVPLLHAGGLDAQNQDAVVSHRALQQAKNNTEKPKKTTLVNSAKRLSLCAWEVNSGNCFPDVLNNVPKGKILDSLNKDKVCEGLIERDECEAEPAGCIWESDKKGCTVDLLYKLQECLVPEWVAFRRSLQCSQLGMKKQCNRVSGCKWKKASSSCEVDEAAVSQAAGSSSALSIDIATMKGCAELSLEQCAGSCTFDGDKCFYPPVLDTNKWFHKDLEDLENPACLFLKEEFVCQGLGIENCAGNCELATTGTKVICAPSAGTLVDLAFYSDLNLQQRFRNALRVCPTLTTEGDCLNYT